MASFTDDFNRADSSDLGAGWVEVSGDWSIISNQLSPGSAGGTIILRAAGAMDSSDNSAQATISATTAASHGVWCRGNSNITSGYLWRNDGTSWDLFWVVGGSFGVIGTYTAGASPGDVARVQAVGSTIKGFVNGVERVSVTDTAVTTGTNVGIRTESVSGIRFDDFAAADVAAGQALGSAAAVETAQRLTGAKTTTLNLAADSHTAQPVTGVKTATLTVAATSESAETLAGAKTALLPVALEAAAAQLLSVSVNRSLSTATAVETAQLLTGAKSATLGPAVETSTGRPLTDGTDDDVDITVGAPYSATYSAAAPHGSGWEVGAPW